MSTRGFFGIGISHGKTSQNLGSLWRSARNFGADFIFTVGKRYSFQPSDTLKTWRHCPLWEFADVQTLKKAMPREALLIGVELDDRASEIAHYCHHERAVYLLGAEDHGLTPDERDACHRLVQLPGYGCLNVAVAGGIVMYDRWRKRERTARIAEKEAAE